MMFLNQSNIARKELLGSTVMSDVEGDLRVEGEILGALVLFQRRCKRT